MKKNYFIVCLAIIAMTHVANAAQLAPLKGTATLTDITSNLELFLKFDETSGTNAADETSNTNNGTLRSKATFTTNGIQGGCVNFTGEENSDITVADNASLNPTAAITVSIWYNAPATTTGGNLIMKQRYDAAYELSYSNQSWDAAERNVKFRMINLGSVSATFDAGNTGEGSGAWHMATGTYDGTTMKIYLDGVLASSFAITGTVPVNNSTLWIGSAEYGGYFNGKLDEPRIYSRALSADDVAALYALKNGTVVTRYQPSKSDLINVYQSAGILVVDLKSFEENSTISIINSNGVVEKQINSAMGQVNINISNHGIYLVRVQNGAKNYIRKVVIN